MDKVNKGKTWIENTADKLNIQVTNILKWMKLRKANHLIVWLWAIMWFLLECITQWWFLLNTEEKSVKMRREKECKRAYCLQTSKWQTITTSKLINNKFPRRITMQYTNANGIIILIWLNVWWIKWMLVNFNKYVDCFSKRVVNGHWRIFI